jgi:hypothetical protein
MLKEVGSGLWVAEVPLKFMGIEVGRQMTVARLRGGELWIHSPAPLTSELSTAIEALGEPRYVVAASAIHGHVSMDQFRRAYPNVQLFAPPILDRRRKDLAFDGLLGSTPEPPWSAVLDQTVFLGQLLPEVLFLHRESRTLIVGDLLVQVEPHAPRATRMAWRLDGVRRSLATPRSVRISTRNRLAARRSVEQMNAWDFDRIHVGHGANVETDGRARFEEAMRWLHRPDADA